MVMDLPLCSFIIKSALRALVFARRASLQMAEKGLPLSSPFDQGVWGLVPNAICADAKPRREEVAGEDKSRQGLLYLVTGGSLVKNIFIAAHSYNNAYCQNDCAGRGMLTS